MADRSVTIDLNLKARTEEAAKAKAAIDDIGKAARKAADETGQSAKRASSSFSLLARAGDGLKRLLGALGATGAVLGVASAVAKIADSFKHAEAQAAKFQAIQDKLAKGAALDSLAAKYERLKEAAAAAAREIDQAFELDDAKTSNSRRLEEAQAQADTQAKLAALDPDDPQYERKRALIQAQSDAAKASRNASWAEDDVRTRQRKILAGADILDAQADAQAANSRRLERAIGDAQRNKSNAEFAARDLNEADKSGGVADTIGKTVKQLVTGDWGRMAGATTAEGDHQRLAAAERAAAIEKEIAAISEELRKSREQEAALRDQAAHRRSMARELDNTVQAVESESSNERNAAAANVAAAQNAIERESAKNADARRAVAQLSAARDRINDEISRRRAAKDQASLDVFNAQQDYSLATANNSPNAKNAAAVLKSANEAAFRVNAEADAAILALTKTLNEISAKLDAARQQLDQQASRNAYAWADAPAAQ